MNKNSIYDSREITDSELWEEFEKEYNSNELREILEFAGDCITIPELMDWLKENFGNNKIYLVGGGINECLKEVELALHSLNKKYNVIKEWTY